MKREEDKKETRRREYGNKGGRIFNITFKQ
jgi:hypothetical protein